MTRICDTCQFPDECPRRGIVCGCGEAAAAYIASATAELRAEMEALMAVERQRREDATAAERQRRDAFDATEAAARADYMDRVSVYQDQISSINCYCPPEGLPECEFFREYQQTPQERIAQLEERIAQLEGSG